MKVIESTPRKEQARNKATLTVTGNANMKVTFEAFRNTR